MIKIESYKKGALLSVIFNGLAKAILFLLTIIIARYFGANIKTDIYFFIYSTMVLFSGFVNAIDIAVVIPESMRIREKEGSIAAMNFLNYFLRFYLVLGVVFVVGMYFFGTTIFGLISKFSEADILLYRNYFLLGSFYFLFQIITNYINNTLTSLKYFTMPMIISGINSCIIIGGIFLLHYEFDVMSVLISGVSAYSINLIILFIVLKRSVNWNFGGPVKRVSRKNRGDILYTSLGQLTTTASSYFPLYLLSGFGAGVISSLSYGKSIADIPNTLLTAQVSNVSGVQLNEMASKKNFTGMDKAFLTTSKTLVFILVPVGFFMFVFAAPIVELLYKSSNFDEAAAHSTTIFVQLLAASVFSIAINSMLTRVFIAMQAIRQSFIYQVIMNIILLVMIWAFVRYYGAIGYGYAMIIINCASFIIMFFVSKMITPFITYGSLAKYTALIIGINAVIAVGMYHLSASIHVDILWRLVLAVMVWVAVLIMLTKLFKLDFSVRLKN